MLVISHISADYIQPAQIKYKYGCHKKTEFDVVF